MNFENCCCHLPYESYAYAQYGVQSNPVSNSDMPMFPLFQEGSQIVLTSNTEITLLPGYLYLVDFIFLATPEEDSYMQITPKVNGALKLLYSYFAPSGSASPNASASGSFTLPITEDNAVLSFRLSYPAAVRNIDITGAVSVTTLHKLQRGSCC